MINNDLKVIDFSQGIRSNEIEHNFKALEEQIKEERKCVSGSGLADGFEFNIKDFTLKINSGSFVDGTGARVYVKESIVNIEKPILINRIESLRSIDDNMRISLQEPPYANNRIELSENLKNYDTKFSGISINKSGQIGDSSIVYVSDISKNVLTLSSSNNTAPGRKVDVSYNYAHKRRDIVFINKKHEVEYRIGLSSPSPSVPSVSDRECLYVLGYIEVDPKDNISEDNIGATAKIVKEFKSYRNVYTDEKNRLYLCGTPFSSIKTIHMAEPKDPEEGTFWYDMYTNKLKVWRHTDSFVFSDRLIYTSSAGLSDFKINTGVEYLCNQNQISVYVNNEPLDTIDFLEGTDFTEEERIKGLVYSKEFTITKPLKKGDIISYRIERYDGFAEWVAVSDTTYVPVREHFIFTPEIMQNYEIDKLFNKQHFIFHSKENRNMLFVPNTNAVTVIIDQVPLHSDQFSEITINDAIAGKESAYISKVLKEHYGYDKDFAPSIANQEYENIGVGIRLSKSLLRDSYVEIIVEHRVNTNPISKRFQRSATFVNEGSYIYESHLIMNSKTVSNAPIFTTDVKFAYEENQIDVFLNGRKLIRNIEFKENAKSNSLKGEMINSFEILPESGIINGSKVEYKITTSIYSYDHLSTIFEDYEKKLSLMDSKVEKASQTITSLSNDVSGKIEIVDKQIDVLMNMESNLDNTFMKKDTRIGKDNLSIELYQGIVQECFYETLQISMQNETINITSICNEKDFINVVNTSQNNGNKVLRRDIDFTISKNGNQVLLNVTTSAVDIGDFLYISGIKFRRG